MKMESKTTCKVQFLKKLKTGNYFCLKLTISSKNLIEPCYSLISMLKFQAMFYKKILFIGLIIILSANASFAKPPKVLVFSKTTFFYHESIPNGIAAIQVLGKQMH